MMNKAESTTQFWKDFDTWGGISDKAIFQRALGVALKQARERRGVEQVKVAEWLGVTQSQYSKYEKGKAALSVYQFARLCLVFSVKASDLVPMI